MNPIVAYLIVIAFKPLPFIAGGLTVGWVVASFEMYANDYVALAVPVGLSVGFSLTLLPYVLELHRAAKKVVDAQPPALSAGLVAIGVGVLVLTGTGVLMTRAALANTG